MAQRKPGRRPKPEKVPPAPRDRLAEIRDAQQQIEAKRRDPHVIRTAEDLTAWERAAAERTDRLAALLRAEAMPAALDDPENRRQARP